MKPIRLRFCAAVLTGAMIPGATLAGDRVHRAIKPWNGPGEGRP